MKDSSVDLSVCFRGMRTRVRIPKRPHKRRANMAPSRNPFARETDTGTLRVSHPAGFSAVVKLCIQGEILLCTIKWKAMDKDT